MSTHSESVDLVSLPWDPVASKMKTLWMEQCHVAYLRALTAMACCSMAKPEPDIHKIDWQLQHELVHMPIGVQLKSTTQDVWGEDHVTCTIDAATHEKLRVNDSYRRFLFFLVLPHETPWVSICDESLAISRRMFWLDVKGESRLTADSKTYRVPLNQQVTPEWLCSIFTSLTRGN